MLVGLDKMKLGHGHSTGDSGSEPDESPAGMLGILFVILIVVLFAIGFATKAYLSYSVAEQQALQWSIPNPQLIEMGVKDLAELTSYDVVNEAQGQYRIPVEKAMEILVKNQSIIVK